MKFTDALWHRPTGPEFSGGVEVIDVLNDGKNNGELDFLAATRHVAGRGDTLNGKVQQGSIKAALMNYAKSTGKPALPPSWTYGLYLSTSFTPYDEKTVLSFLDDPETYIKTVKEKYNVKVCVWINLYISQRASIFQEGVDNGYFIKRANGDVWQWDFWQAGMAVVAFTNPEACKWYAKLLQGLMDIGVDTFKTDFGERIPRLGVEFHDGGDPVKAHNL
ncbi:hypothetical protein QFC24_007087 [Naganishia onofrii]|uniref:Uncharacterized protein n=1 Tax=Naganishia onofrii TaxID=1851511 RepID=A0ACC2WVW5_9TREE|nr:hypothetical protein QFC24_007087 [Naganishia onofrii]